MAQGRDRTSENSPRVNLRWAWDSKTTVSKPNTGSRRPRGILFGAKDLAFQEPSAGGCDWTPCPPSAALRKGERLEVGVMTDQSCGGGIPRRL